MKELIQGIDRQRIEQFSTSKGIEWKFNPPLSQHMGGVLERLVRSTKEVMSALLVEKTLTDQQLYTLLTEALAILNNRPLTHLLDNPEDLDPPSRIAYREPPFSNCGVDMFRPIFIKQGR